MRMTSSSTGRGRSAASCCCPNLSHAPSWRKRSGSSSLLRRSLRPRDRQGTDRLGDLVENRFPIAALFLPEEPHGRIPGRIFACREPAPIRHVFQRQEYGTPESAGKMRDRRIGGYDQMAVRHDGRRIDESIRSAVQGRTEAFDRKIRRRFWILGEADEPDAFDRRKLPEALERNAAFEIDVQIAAPANSDPKSFISDPCGPFGNALGLRMKVGNGGRHRFERRAEGIRQAHQGDLVVIVLMIVDGLDETRSGRQSLDEAEHRLAAEQSNLRAARDEQGKISAELDEIAEPLLVPDENTAAADLFAVPGGKWRDDRSARRIAALPAALESGEAALQIAEDQKQAREIIACVGIVGLELQGRDN